MSKQRVDRRKIILLLTGAALALVLCPGEGKQPENSSVVKGINMALPDAQFKKTNHPVRWTFTSWLKVIPGKGGIRRLWTFGFTPLKIRRPGRSMRSWRR
ncbi:hypothetical protein CS542_08945 [Pedobacter sp. IW39]|nr:hypothetical protein CS542_08945 [Pedobacter sp. IW39]